MELGAGTGAVAAGRDTSNANSASASATGDLLERTFTVIFARQSKSWFRTTVEGAAARGCHNR
jgi:hypothetical protein